MPYTAPDPARIRTMFAAIASRYDRANNILSAGVHHLWRRRAVRYSGAGRGARVLDCATGTGDLAVAFHTVTGRVVGTDFVAEMVHLARQKAPGIPFSVADVTQLPFERDSFDIVSIAFGIRNVGNPAKGIEEMARVLKPGGRLVVLEFGQPPSPILRRIYDAYRTRLLPRVGGVITGHRDAYAYLDRSSAEFPSGEEFVALLKRSAPFVSADYQPLSFGIAWVYRAVKR
ncbi:MAG TPA: bifunctional demethylmenaquinone methyltransferase/2-methoxy-6-polyprenyl-1,4-benzoquinol methylase UbiE [Thermoanaerobaculia bacterium]|nr:bifunctional demethylmenaquinone methyltransferase/2-methoxy-6-polyprenyl-1,4-benzoquinol methylase UbiE [Thermoanaerobaculia bacterium]